MSKILIDLKPALDGYAGIPQEARLLFLELRTHGNHEVEGLIQHGARNLKSAIPRKHAHWEEARKINRLSQVVVSMYKKPSNNPIDYAINYASDAVRQYLAAFKLHLRSQLGLSVPTYQFESELFDDFVWRTFFSKTLKPVNKDLLASAKFRLIRQSRNLLHRAGLVGLKYTNKPRYPRIDTHGFDYFLSQTPFPGRVSGDTQMIVRYHDAVPVFWPHTISDKVFHQASHFYALQDNVRAGAWFSCVSESTREDLLKIFPEAEPRSVVIPNIVSNEYFDESSAKTLVFQVIRNRLCATNGLSTNVSGIPFLCDSRQAEGFRYILMVSTIEPRKNHLMLMEAWERLKYTTMPDLKLIVVGSIGWDEKPVIKAFRPWAERGDLFHLSNVPAFELRMLYKHAQATVCPSLAEGFDYSGIEAMRSGGVVISSDIPVHREIYGNASEYFNPYSSEDIAQAITRVIARGGAGLSADLRSRGKEIAGHYTSQVILPKWNDFLSALERQRPGARGLFGRNTKSGI